MGWIEIIGLPGSGKTTLLERFKKAGSSKDLWG
jgi:GTPase SAR1 family protein